jgi:hypothetical protein
MRISIPYGNQHAEIELPDIDPVEVRRAPESPVFADPMAALQASLESPRDFPALRLALTPGDQVAMAVDRFFVEHREFWLPVLEHVASAGVRPSSMTVVLPRESPADANVGLEPPWADVQVIKHDPSNRKRLSYLATTRAGQRIYLNRTIVDADQLIALAKCEYGPRGPTGAEDAIFPGLSDAETISELRQHSADGRGHKRAMGPAKEVTWLLGAPFMIHAIEGAGGGLCHFIAGAADSVPYAMQMLGNCWHVELSAPGDVVITSITGAAQNGFLDFANALANARKAAKPGGRIVLIANGSPAPGPAMQLLCDAADLPAARHRLQDEGQGALDYEEARQWCQAVEAGHVYLYSGLSDEIAEGLFVTPLSRLEELGKLVKPQDQVVALPAGNKCEVTLAHSGWGRRSTKPASNS